MPYDVKNPPNDPKLEFPRRPAVGCWRAHANLWSHIITSGISSALILEDDADFSVGIRDIMEGVSTHLQGVFGARSRETYGIVKNSWDVLALGTCYNRLPDPNEHPGAARKIRSWVDPYAPERDDLSKKYLPFAESKRVRVLGPTLGMACTQAYAVTREGVMRLLYNVGGPGHILDRPLDILMGDQMIAGLLNGFVTIPSIFGQWKYGEDWRDTDIQEFTWAEKGSGADIIQSTRQEIMDVLGNRNIWDEMERE